MKAKKIFSLYALALAAIALNSCNDFLSETPDNRVELNTVEQAAQLLTNAYPSAAYTFTEWMSDNVSYTTGTSKQPEHIQAYLWQDITPDNQDTPINYWNSAYDAIAHANEVLAVIDKLPGELAEKRAVKGEAYLTRAYAHFMLVNLFAKHYVKEDASKDLGIPYVSIPETEFIKQYDRGNVEQVYRKIENDILAGLQFVDASFYKNSGKYHFNKDAALALASRYYLFKGDYENCIKYSTEMFGSNPDIFVKDIARLLEETPNGDDFIREYTSPTDQSNLLVVRNVTNFPVNVGFWPTYNQVASIYNSNPWNSADIRISDQYPIYTRGNGVTLAKYEFLFERTSLTSNVGLYYTIMPVFRGEEVLLNCAESYALTTKYNEAIAVLQSLVKKRYPGKILSATLLKNYYNTSNTISALMNFIVDERQKEFMHEGLRWFDIKRFKIPVTHDMGNGGFELLQADDLRKVIQIPQTAIDVGGLKQNPRK